MMINKRLISTIGTSKKSKKYIAGSVSAIVPVIISKKSGIAGAEFRIQSGELSSFVLDNLRGIKETIQYNNSENRLDELNRRTDELSEKQKKISRSAGIDAAITNTVILIFDLIMQAISACFIRAMMSGLRECLFRQSR